MHAHQERLTRLLIETPDVLDITDYKLADTRPSTYKFQFGMLSQGHLIDVVGECYAEELLQQLGLHEKHILYGLPKKGDAIAVATAIALGRRGVRIRFFSLRDAEKEHGIKGDTLLEKLVVGGPLHPNDHIIKLDDVITGAATKLKGYQQLQYLRTPFGYPLLLVGVDRQELTLDGQPAREAYTNATRIPIASILNASMICEALLEQGMRDKAKAIAAQLLQHGTEEARRNMKRLGL